MRWLTYPLLVWLALLVQTTWSETLTVFGTPLDVVLLLAVWLGLNADWREAGLAGWGLGLAQDVLSVGPVGPHAVAYLALCYVLAVKRKSLSGGHPAGQAAVAFAVVLLFHLGEPLIHRLAGGSGGPRFGAALAEAFYAGLAAPLIYAVLNRCRTGWTPKSGR